MLLHRDPQDFPICLPCLWLLMLRVLTQCSCEGLLWWGELRKEHPPGGSLGSSLCSSPLQFSFRTAAASVWCYMRFLSFSYGEVVAARCRFCCLFRVFPMQEATTATQAWWRLSALGPDMAKVLAVVGTLKAMLLLSHWSSCYSLRKDRTENTVNNSSPIAACVSVAVITWWLLIHCLTTGFFAEPFHSNGCLFWLHNSGFLQTYDNTRTYTCYRSQEEKFALQLPKVFLLFMVLIYFTCQIWWEIIIHSSFPTPLSYFTPLFLSRLFLCYLLFELSFPSSYLPYVLQGKTNFLPSLFCTFTPLHLHLHPASCCILSPLHLYVRSNLIPYLANVGDGLDFPPYPNNAEDILIFSSYLRNSRRQSGFPSILIIQLLPSAHCYHDSIVVTIPIPFLRRRNGETSCSGLVLIHRVATLNIFPGFSIRNQNLLYLPYFLRRAFWEK
jgi:hypothetical protein